MFSISNLLILINVLVFLYVNQLSGSTFFEYNIAKFGMGPTNFTSPIVWVSSAFLHANLMHLAFNMFALYDFGNPLEKRVGKMKFVIIFVVSMITASLYSYIFLAVTHVDIVVIGSSGAIFGVWAARSIFLKEMKEFLIISAVFHIALFAFHMPIAWYAHLGGAVAGILLGLLFSPRYYIPMKKVSS